MKPTQKVASGHILLRGDPDIPVILRRSAQARRLSLRVSRLKGAATLSLPKRYPLRDAESFVREKEAWIRKHLAHVPTPQDIIHGSEILFRGERFTLQPTTGRATQIKEGSLLVPGQGDMVSARVKAFLKQQAKLALHNSTARYAEHLGKPYGRITLRDTTSRWGSCSSRGNLNYSWRLIMAPPEVLNYVAAHEVCHLAEMNHSAAFWAHVRRLFPGYEAQKDWLREHGEVLHSFRF